MANPFEASVGGKFAFLSFLVMTVSSISGPGVLASYCGSEWNDTVVLSSDEERYILRRPDITLPIGVSVSPGSSYCRVTIEDDGKSVTEVEVEFFHLGGSERCTVESERIEFSIEGREDVFVWCGQTYAKTLQYSGKMSLTYHFNQKTGSPGFQMIFRTKPAEGYACPQQPPTLQAGVVPMLLYTTGFFPLRTQPLSCEWNLESDQREMIVFHIRDIFGDSSCYDLSATLGGPEIAVCYQSDFFASNKTTLKISVKEQRWGVENYGLALEYVEGSKEVIICQDGTSVQEYNVPSQDVLHYFIWNVTQGDSCTFDLVADPSNPQIDLTFAIPPNQMSASGGLEALLRDFSVEVEDGPMTAVNEFRGRQALRNLQSADRRVSLTYTKTGSKNIIDMFRTRAYEPGNFPRYLMASTTKSYIWFSEDRFWGRKPTPLRITNMELCVRIEVFNRAGTEKLIPYEKVAVYDGPDDRYFELTKDCLGNPRMEEALNFRRKRIAVVPRGDYDGGFWLVYTSFESRAFCGGHPEMMLSVPGDYRLPDDVVNRNARCSFSIGKDNTNGRLLRFTGSSNIDREEGEITLMEVVPGRGGTRSKKTRNVVLLKSLPGNASDPSVYSKRPMALFMKLPSLARTKDRFLRFRVEYDDDGDKTCSSSSRVATRQKQHLASPNFPDYYLTDLMCTWNIVKSDEASEEEHIVIEVMEYPVFPCQRYSRNEDSLKIGPKNGPVTPMCGEETLPFYRMYENFSSVEAVFVSDQATVLTGFQITYYVKESSDYDNCNQVITLTGGNTPYTIEGRFLPQHYTGPRSCWWKIKSAVHHQVVTMIDAEVNFPPAAPDTYFCFRNNMLDISSGEGLPSLAEYCGLPGGDKNVTSATSQFVDVFVELSLPDQLREPLSFKLVFSTTPTDKKYLFPEDDPVDTMLIIKAVGISLGILFIIGGGIYYCCCKRKKSGSENVVDDGVNSPESAMPLTDSGKNASA